MKSFAFCPVSDKQVNERVARINAAFTVMLLALYALTGSVIPVLILTVDFLLRAADYSKFSIIALSSKGIVRYLAINENLINAGPKLFAARIGFVFSILIAVSILLNAWLPAYVLAGVLGMFSLLESVFGLCVACEIYPYVYRLLQLNQEQRTKSKEQRAKNKDRYWLAF